MLTGIPFSLYFGDGDIPALLVSSGITAGVGFLLFRLTRVEHELRTRDGFAVVTFGWLLLSLFGTLPYLLSGSILSFTDAFFETISGFTTTGASILNDIEALPHGVLFWRSMTHWMGGMGIIVLSLAVLPLLGVGGMQLYKAEVAGPTTDKLTPRITQTAKILWGVYLLITVAEVVLLMVGGMSLFDALCIAFGTVASGGFAPTNTSIAAYPSAFIQWVIVFFMVVAGTNFALHYRFLIGQRTAYRRDREFHVFIGSLVVASIIVGTSTFRIYPDWTEALRNTVFTVTSLQSSTGFASADYEQWSSLAQATLLLIMIVGGSAGSTSGGLKVVRAYLVFKYIGSEFTRIIHPQAVVPTRVHGIAVQREVMMNVLSYFALYMVTILTGFLAITATGLDWASSLSAVISCLGGVGPGMGQLGPFDNYSQVTVVGKWLLALLMLLGRLEFYSFLVLLTPVYWRR